MEQARFSQHPLLQPRRRVLLMWDLCALAEGKKEGASASPGFVLPENSRWWASEHIGPPNPMPGHLPGILHLTITLC